jgi:hypothetical protein
MVPEANRVVNVWSHFRTELAIGSPLTLDYTPNHMIFSLAYCVKKKQEVSDAGAGEGTSAYRAGRT